MNKAFDLSSMSKPECKSFISNDWAIILQQTHFKNDESLLPIQVACFVHAPCGETLIGSSSACQQLIDVDGRRN